MPAAVDNQLATLSGALPEQSRRTPIGTPPCLRLANAAPYPDTFVISYENPEQDLIVVVGRRSRAAWDIGWCCTCRGRRDVDDACLAPVDGARPTNKWGGNNVGSEAGADRHTPMMSLYHVFRTEYSVLRMMDDTPSFERTWSFHC